MHPLKKWTAQCRCVGETGFWIRRRVGYRSELLCHVLDVISWQRMRTSLSMIWVWSQCAVHFKGWPQATSQCGVRFKGYGQPLKWTPDLHHVPSAENWIPDLSSTKLIRNRLNSFPMFRWMFHPRISLESTGFDLDFAQLSFVVALPLSERTLYTPTAKTKSVTRSWNRIYTVM